MTLTSEVRVIVADDEPLARARVRALLAEHPSFKVLGEFGSGRSTLEAIHRLTPDLLFLDVQMPGGTGIEVLEQLAPAERPITVFTTAFDRYALAAFDLHALDYLLKPFDDQRFRETLERAVMTLDAFRLSEWRKRFQEMIEGEGPGRGGTQGTAAQSQRFLCRRGDTVEVVHADDVIWFEGDGDYVKLHTNDRTHLVRITMQLLERRLDAQRFVRVHRSAIVAIKCVRSVVQGPSGAMAVLDAGKRIPIGRRYRTRVLDVLASAGV